MLQVQGRQLRQLRCGATLPLPEASVARKLSNCKKIAPLVQFATTMDHDCTIDHAQPEIFGPNAEINNEIESSSSNDDECSINFLSP